MNMLVLILAYYVGWLNALLIKQHASFKRRGGGEEIEPKIITLEEIKDSWMHPYLKRRLISSGFHGKSKTLTITANHRAKEQRETLTNGKDDKATMIIDGPRKVNIEHGELNSFISVSTHEYHQDLFGDIEKAFG